MSASLTCFISGLLCLKKLEKVLIFSGTGWCSTHVRIPSASMHQTSEAENTLFAFLQPQCIKPQGWKNNVHVPPVSMHRTSEVKNTMLAFLRSQCIKPLTLNKLHSGVEYTAAPIAKLWLVQRRRSFRIL